MDEIKDAITNISTISSNLEDIKEKLTSEILSDEQSTITKINKKLTDAINAINTFATSNATELNNIKNNDTWIN